MANPNNEFQIVGRYLDGKTVTAYHLQSLGSGKAGKYTKEQVAYLIGKELITNCTAQIYKGKLLLRGKGMSLDDLPTKQENGELKNTDSIGRIKRGTSAEDAMEQLMIVGALKSGKRTVGYIAQNAGCGTVRLSRKKVLELAEQGKIGNARVQNYNGDKLLRGVGINLDSLPSEEVENI